MRMHLVMPMGGSGSRFSENGYSIPKPLIEINGKPFLYWSTMSIIKHIEEVDLIFVVLEQHIQEYQIDEVIKTYFPRAGIVSIPHVLPGPVFTALQGTESISDGLPVVFNDCDHMFKCSQLNRIIDEQSVLEDGYLLTFESQEPQYSYISYDNNGCIIGTMEKKVVSSHAICGAYVFKNVQIFRAVAQKYVNNCPYKESFMSGIYNVMCNEGMRVKDLPLDYHVEFGTPEEYNKAKESIYFKELDRI